MTIRFKPAIALPDYCCTQLTKGRLYVFARYKGVRLRLHALPGSLEFTAEYAKAIEQLKGPAGINLARKGSVRGLAVAYLASDIFGRLSGTQQRRYRQRIERFAELNGHRDANTLDNACVRDALAAIESASERRLVHYALSGMFGWGNEQHPPLVRANPFVGIKADRPAESTNHRRWMPDHMAAFRAAHPDLGSVERRAFELIVSTLARGPSDVSRFTRAHIRDGMISFVARKNGETMDGIPLSPLALATVAAHAKAKPTDLAFFRGRDGGPMSKDAFGKMFKRACLAAGLDDLTAHGLRHAGACEMAERGESLLTIQQALGDRNPAAAMVYVQQAEGVRMRREAHQRRWEQR